MNCTAFSERMEGGYHGEQEEAKYAGRWSILFGGGNRFYHIRHFSSVSAHMGYSYYDLGYFVAHRGSEEVKLRSGHGVPPNTGGNSDTTNEEKACIGS